MDAGPALSVAAELGPYFSWARWPQPGQWRPLGDLLAGDVAAERVDAAREALRTMFGVDLDAAPARVVASVTFLGLAARLVSPLLGAAVVGGALPTPAVGQLWWRPVAGGPWPMAFHQATATDAAGLDDATLAEAFAAVAVRGLVAPLLAVFADRFRLSGQVLWGNVASALAGAVGMLAAARPAHAERAGRVLEQVMAVAPLAGTGTVVRPAAGESRRFLVRGNCCLYYRIPGAGLCGDCVLMPAADRRQHWQSVLGSR
jgi:ferric iron reductase protein FhuF